MRYEYFTVDYKGDGFVIADDTGDILGGHTISSAFNVLGKMGAQLEMQTESGVFVFEREVVEASPIKEDIKQLVIDFMNACSKNGQPLGEVSSYRKLIKALNLKVVEMYPGKGVEMYELRGANNDN